MIVGSGPPALLMARPGNLHNLWKEYMVGLNGNKAARLFTAEERGQASVTYCRRNAFWSVISTMVRSGVSADVAVDRVYQTYGYNLSITAILRQMAKDKKLPGGAHANLVV